MQNLLAWSAKFILRFGVQNLLAWSAKFILRFGVQNLFCGLECKIYFAKGMNGGFSSAGLRLDPLYPPYNN